MKRIALFFAVAIAAISCTTEVTVTPEITVLTGEDELVHSPAEGYIPVAFKVNTDWTAVIKEAEAKEWCAITPSKGKAGEHTLNVLCLENKNTENRSATVVIKAMDITQEVEITQLQTNVLALTAKKEYTIPYTGGELTFKVSHNLDLEVSSNVSWITEVKSKAMVETEVKFAVAPNSGEARSGKIVFTAGPLQEEIVVNQEPWVLEFDVTPLEDKVFEVNGGEHKFTVNANVDYFVNMKSNNWLTLTNNGNEYTIKAAANEAFTARETEVYISPKSAKYVEAAKAIKVSQKAAGAKLEVSLTEKRVTCLAQTFDLTVDATIDYTITCESSDGTVVDWLSYTKSGNVYTVSVTENATWSERSALVYVTPKDIAYESMAATIGIYQYGHAFKMWCKQITTIPGYDATQKVRLAKYGDKLLLANTTKVFVMNPTTGEVENTISMPAGVNAHSVLVDDAGNFMIAADAYFDKDNDGVELVLYLVPDPMNPAPEKVFSYNVRNYYGTQTGNVRVKGDIKKNAVITAVVSDGQDGENPEDGAVLMWEVINGVCGEWKYTNAPYTAWGIESLCAYPAGTSLADGVFYIGYGGDYNLKFTQPTLGSASEWATTYVTGSTWQENYNCIHTTEWKGNKYAAIIRGCHFNYDDADMVLLNVNNPVSAEFVYEYSGTYDVERNKDWANLWWTGGGPYSDIVLIPTSDAMLMIGADSNYGTITCVTIM